MKNYYICKEKLDDKYAKDKNISIIHVNKDVLRMVRVISDMVYLSKLL